MKLDLKTSNSCQRVKCVRTQTAFVANRVLLFASKILLRF